MPFSLVNSRCIGNDPAWDCNITTVSDGAYCYCSNQQIWYTYDGPTQMLQKAQFVASEGLGGVMFWQLPGDNAAFQLTEALVTGGQSTAPPTSAPAAAIVAIIL